VRERNGIAEGTRLWTNSFQFPEDKGYAEAGIFSNYDKAMIIHGSCMEKCTFY